VTDYRPPLPAEYYPPAPPPPRGPLLSAEQVAEPARARLLSHGWSLTDADATVRQLAARVSFAENGEPIVTLPDGQIVRTSWRAGVEKYIAQVLEARRIDSLGGDPRPDFMARLCAGGVPPAIAERLASNLRRVDAESLGWTGPSSHPDGGRAHEVVGPPPVILRLAFDQALREAVLQARRQGVPPAVSADSEYRW
jgi:hypothetical protein